MGGKKKITEVHPSFLSVTKWKHKRMDGRGKNRDFEGIE